MALIQHLAPSLIYRKAVIESRSWNFTKTWCHSTRARWCENGELSPCADSNIQFHCSYISLSDWDKCVRMEDIGREPRADLRARPTESFERATLNGNGRHFWRSLDRFCSRIPVLAISRNPNVRQPVSSRTIHDNFPLQPNSNAAAQCQVLAFKSSGEFFDSTETQRWSISRN